MKATVFHQSAHLQEQELSELSVLCPFCESTDRSSIAILQKDPDVLLLRCCHCYASSASRMPKPEALMKYYGHYYDDKEEKITFDAPVKIASHIFRHSKSYVTGSGEAEIAMLDYGGGDGSISTKIAKFLLDVGVETVSIGLIDYDQSVKATVDQDIRISRPKDLYEIQEGTMDLVIASAVLEHIPDPRDILVKLLASLKVGGVFYARTPYVYPLMKLANACNSQFDFTYPAHVHDLGARFWNNITNILPTEEKFQILRSTPSIVETSFNQHFLRTLAAHILKAPGYVFKESYGLVGGWEVFIRRRS
jgi:2-polyprenyl-3-methyl-5-hydroxy-6-metoxy-1,4-benzoquinol methylase